MAESVIDGLVLEENDGDQVILTDIDQLAVAETGNFDVIKFLKRSKSYFKLVRK